MFIGECMVEIAPAGDGHWQMGVAGDTYNCAVYMKRVADALGVTVRASYITGIGDDEFSAMLRSAWQAEGIEDQAVVIPGRLPGLYAALVDEAGERRFRYWRRESAARCLFEGAAGLPAISASIIYFSGITLQLFSPAQLEALFSALGQQRAAGSYVAFDTNYRSRGWEDRSSAEKAIDRAVALSDLVLTSLDDECLLHELDGQHDVQQRLASANRPETVLKLGPLGSAVLCGGTWETVPAEVVVAVRDTTAAGDSFAGAYLAARIGGLAPLEAARLGARVASVVIGHPGAVLGREIRLVEGGASASAHSL